MEVIAILALVGGVGYGMEHDWQAAKAYSHTKNVVLKILNFITQ